MSQISFGTCAGATRSGRASRQLEAGLIEGPLDFDRHAEHAFRLAHEPAERGGLSGLQARRAHQSFRHRLRPRAGAVHADFAVVLAPAVHRAQKARPAEHDAVRHYLALRDGGPSPQVALISMWPSAVSLKPPPEAVAATSG